MLKKQQILEAMQREIDVAVHLHGKIPAGAMDFRFTPKQRSTRELLRYLSYVGIGAAQSMAEGSWDPYEACEKRAESEAPAEFPVAMARQKKELSAFFAGISEADLETKRAELPWGTKTSLGEAILQLAYACLVAYRMQLFLHAKAAGNTSLATANCWGGMDMPAPATV
jgi:hypothetical protein